MMNRGISSTITDLIRALQAVGETTHCDWLSSQGPKVIKIDLTEVCGGSGHYGRPKRVDPYLKVRMAK